MQGSSQIGLMTFKVEVVFFSGDERYGVETYTIMAASWYQAEQEALACSVSSIYDVDRIPDLHRQACTSPAG
jgi:hypothetical protein